MEPAPLAQAGGGGVQARTADLQRLASWRYPKSPPTPETALEVAGCETARSPARHTRQPRQEHALERRHQVAHPASTLSLGGQSEKAAHRQTHQTCVDATAGKG